MKTGRFMGLFGALLLANLVKDDMPKFRGYNYAIGGYNPMFIPKHTKFKGYMRERNRCSFNKNR